MPGRSLIAPDRPTGSSGSIGTPSLPSLPHCYPPTCPAAMSGGDQGNRGIRWLRHADAPRDFLRHPGLGSFVPNPSTYPDAWLVNLAKLLDMSATHSNSSRKSHLRISATSKQVRPMFLSPNSLLRLGPLHETSPCGFSPQSPNTSQPDRLSSPI